MLSAAHVSNVLDEHFDLDSRLDENDIFFAPSNITGDQRNLIGLGTAHVCTGQKILNVVKPTLIFSSTTHKLLSDVQ